MSYTRYTAPTLPSSMETIRRLLEKAEDILDQYTGLDDVHELLESAIDETWKEGA